MDNKIQDMILSLEKQIEVLRNELIETYKVDINSEVIRDTVSLIKTNNGYMPISHFIPKINEMRAEAEYQSLLSELKQKKVITVIEIMAFDCDYYAVLMSRCKVNHQDIVADLDILSSLGFEVFSNVDDRLEGYPFVIESIKDVQIL